METPDNQRIEKEIKRLKRQRILFFVIIGVLAAFIVWKMFFSKSENAILKEVNSKLEMILLKSDTIQNSMAYLGANLDSMNQNQTGIEMEFYDFQDKTIGTYTAWKDERKIYLRQLNNVTKEMIRIRSENEKLNQDLRKFKNFDE